MRLLSVHRLAQVKQTQQATQVQHVFGQGQRLAKCASRRGREKGMLGFVSNEQKERRGFVAAGGDSDLQPLGTSSTVPRGNEPTVQQLASRFSPLKAIRVLCILLALVAFAGCSPAAIRVIDLGDLLNAEGRLVNGVVDERGDAERTWWTGYRMPLILPFSPASIASLKVSVGTVGEWLIYQEPEGGQERFVELPETLIMEHATWHFRAFNGEGAIEFTKLVPVNQRLVRGPCSKSTCAFSLEDDSAANELLSFSLAATDLPTLPPQWPRPLSRFILETNLTLNVRHEPGPPLSLRVLLTAGDSELHLFPK